MHRAPVINHLASRNVRMIPVPCRLNAKPLFVIQASHPGHALMALAPSLPQAWNPAQRINPIPRIGATTA